ncbi:MAG: hypothetical protein ACREFP_20400 [Acetobacteraceae bacterium]
MGVRRGAVARDIVRELPLVACLAVRSDGFESVDRGVPVVVGRRGVARQPAGAVSRQIVAVHYRDQREADARVVLFVEQLLKALLPPDAAAPELSDAWNALASEPLAA